MERRLRREEAMTIRVLHERGVSNRAIARQLGVHENAVRYRLARMASGARVIYYALAALQTKQRRIVRDVHLLGGAAGCGDAREWHAVTSAVSGHVFNYFSENDAVLKYAYRAGSGLTSTPIGIQPIGAASEQIIDVDVSALVSEHTAYKKRLSEILEAGVQHRRVAAARVARCA
jgi:hypothetical protein